VNLAVLAAKMFRAPVENFRRDSVAEVAGLRPEEVSDPDLQRHIEKKVDHGGDAGEGGF